MYTHEDPTELRAVAAREPNPVRAALPAPAPDLWPGFTHYLGSRGLPAALAKFNGWYPSREAGDDAPRIVIPATASAGHVFWQARVMDHVTVIHESESSGVPLPKRYMSPHYPRRDAYIKVHPYSWTDRAVIVEGPMCALAAADFGVLGIALMGATPPNVVLDEVVEAIRGYRVIVLSDVDDRGKDENSRPTRVYLLAPIVGRLAARGITSRLETALPYKDLADAPPDWRVRVLSP